MTRNIRIDVVSVPFCPFCLLGLHRLDKALASLPEDVTVELVHHPFLLDTATPVEGVKISDKFGTTKSATRERLEADARRSGLMLDLGKQQYWYPGTPAQALISMAPQAQNIQYAVSRALGQAYYLEARNIADADVLADIGAMFGLDSDEVRKNVTDPQYLSSMVQQAGEIARQGVSGVPTFIFMNTFTLSGAQPESVFADALNKALPH